MADRVYLYRDLDAKRFKVLYGADGGGSDRMVFVYRDLQRGR